MKISTIKTNKNRIVGIVLWLFLWQIVYWIINKDIYFPSPFSVAISIVSLIRNPDFYIVVWSTTFRVFISFLVSALLGVSLGYICGINKKAYDLFEPMIIFIRTTPIISIIIIAIIWFSSSNVPIFTGFLMCFPIIWANMVEGIRNTDKKLLEMCKLYNVGKMEIFKKVYIKASIPYLSAGFSSALGIGWKVVAAAEALSLPKYGIGTNLFNSKIYLQVPELLAWTVIIILISYMFEILVKILFKRIEG
ncbi:MAG: ABC transporter permease subunit [Bacillota bacterium]|nr:ABC transporter permease subunit [Bacillota bacterium]